eukprot:415243-Rhodomonas_salina.1
MLNVRRSTLIAQRSFRCCHSALNTRRSTLVSRRLTLVTCCSSLDTLSLRSSLIAQHSGRRSTLDARRSSLIAHCSLLVARHSAFNAQRSTFDAHCSTLVSLPLLFQIKLLICHQSSSQS